MSESKLTKRLYTDITRLKLLDRDDAEVRFRLTESPFRDDDIDAQTVVQNQDEYIVIGQIFPKSNIFNERSYLIELKLIKTFPVDPPVVRFLTPIYHPNVDKDGKFSMELLYKSATWTPTTSLTQVVKAVVEHIDKPNIDYSIRAEVGREYQENKNEFNRNALEYVRKHGLPR